MPGIDVAVDVTLCMVCAAMYASAGPEHCENVGKALGKLKEHATEIGSVLSRAGLTNASGDFDAFIKLVAREAVDVLSVVAKAPSAPSKLLPKRLRHSTASMASQLRDQRGLFYWGILLSW